MVPVRIMLEGVSAACAAVPNLVAVWDFPIRRRSRLLLEVGDAPHAFVFRVLDGWRRRELVAAGVCFSFITDRADHHAKLVVELELFSNRFPAAVSAFDFNRACHG